MPRRGRSGVNQFLHINAWPSAGCCGAAVAHGAGAAAGPTGAVVELAGTAPPPPPPLGARNLLITVYFLYAAGAAGQDWRSAVLSGGVHNHSPGKSLLREIMQNGYKTCVILTITVFFCNIFNISLEVLQKKRYILFWADFDRPFLRHLKQNIDI